ncbi:MAG TPA: aldo/keto reductase [Polyangiaceae bacterium]|nr:aldo/keto reductase [Polyangiaceae bacterium]
MSRLALGSAQFGLDYGITNRAGQVDEKEIDAILALAAESGVDTIDTARLYGESEAVLGRRLPAESEFRIVTKTVKIGNLSPEYAVQQLHAGLAASLEALRRPSVYALLFHDPSDLTGSLGPVLWSALAKLKSAGVVEKVGVSAYEAVEVDRVLDRYPVDIVQLPFNAIDSRLVDGGQLERLAGAGVEVHARSLFLQGLLLLPLDQIPPRFAPVRSALEQLDAEFARRSLSRLEGLLAMTFHYSEITRFIVGVTSAGDLGAIVTAAEQVTTAGPMDVHLPPIDARYLNPARWPELSSLD